MFALIALACTPEPPGAESGLPPTETGSAPDVVTIRRWKACDRVPGTGLGGAECATAVVPLDWDDAEGDTVELLVKRIPSTEPARAHLWIVHGGPGGSAVDDLDLLSYGLPELRPDLEVYAVDHRGIGGSMRLGCPHEQAGMVAEQDWPACLAALQDEWGPALDQVTTTASARDLGS